MECVEKAHQNKSCLLFSHNDTKNRNGTTSHYNSGRWTRIAVRTSSAAQTDNVVVHSILVSEEDAEYQPLHGSVVCEIPFKPQPEG